METKKQRLLNTYVNNFTMDEAADAVEALFDKEEPSYVVAVNVDVVMKMEEDTDLYDIVNQADLTLVDGKPLMWISSHFHKPIKERIAGSNLVPVLLERAAKNGRTVYFLGGAEGVAELAKKNMEEKYKGLKVIGTLAPPYGFEKDQEACSEVNKSIYEMHPDYLIVCLGCPKQEKYIAAHYKEYGAKVSICAGATIDFMAGTVKRAPKWMQDHGLEWFYRFLQEPTRMFKRYFIDDVQILGLMRKYKKEMQE